VTAGRALAAALALAAPAAQAQVDCTPVRGAQIVRESGCYRLESDIVVDKPGLPGLALYADRVTIDLAGHRIRSAVPPNTAAGIHAIGVRSLVIRDGAIEGFLFGIKAEPAPGQKPPDRVTVRAVTIDGAAARGIYIKARRATIENATVRNVTGVAAWSGEHAIAIELAVDTCRIFRNRIAEIYPDGISEAVAIAFNDPPSSCQVSGNDISNAKGTGYGRDIAFWVPRGKVPQALDVRHNSVNGFAYAFMAPHALSGAFAQNWFTVDCLPGDVATYGSAAASNHFARSRPCGDTPRELRRLAGAGDPNWIVRLAQAYIEQQWIADPAARRAESCRYTNRADELLAPLKDNAAADVQRKRVAAMRRLFCDAR
jgi:hypothetical protein